jgi:hypothetical protein
MPDPGADPDRIPGKQAYILVFVISLRQAPRQSIFVF